MSKTIRRKMYGIGKNKFPYDEWITHDYSKGYFHENGVQKVGKEYSKAIKQFHSDKGVGEIWPTPAWFRRSLERIRRAKQKQETRNILKRVQSGDYDIDDDNYIPIKKTVQWEWW